ncbi:hypothetical protein FACS18949_15030 [Clostridia bacterium]|nr:hypothetical protein FACS189425_01050 [Clostridia bacterium]GHV36058.1 hypothetical protein FACS18949_15030 [Clostridia bacterium]
MKRNVTITIITGLVLATLILWANGYKIMLALNGLKDPIVLDTQTFGEHEPKGRELIVVVADESTGLFAFRRNLWGFWSVMHKGDGLITLMSGGSKTLGEDSPENSYTGAEIHTYYYFNWSLN